MRISSGRVGARLTALLPGRGDLAQMRRDPRRDLLAGLTVAIVALPLALGFGVSSGLGAEAGLATAVIAGALAAVFGGSNLQVSGPTGAMTVVLVPIVAEHGPSGVLTVGLMAGLMLVALALVRAGKYMQYVPAPVVEGFTLGIACVIGLQQIPSALGVPKPEGDRVLVVTWHALQEFAEHPNWTAVAFALVVAAVMLIGTRLRPTIPFSIVAVIAATLVAQVAGPMRRSRSETCRPDCPRRPSPSWIRARLALCWPRRSRWRRWPPWSHCCRPRSPTA